MTGKRRFAVSIASIALAGSVMSCSESEREGAPLPVGPPVVTVTMREYRFDYSTPVPSGRVVFRFVNEGRIVHQPDMIPLSEDLPPIDEQLRGDVRTAVTQFAGIPPRNPGEVGTYAVDLVPGQRYAIICFARDPDDDESHALQGMNTEFRAGGVLPPTSTTAAG